MKLKMLEENYITCKVVYIDFSKYESIRDINIVNETISILDLLQMLENESNLSIDDKGTITCRDMLNPSIISDDDRLFMFTFHNLSPKIYFVSAKSYDEAYYIVKTWTSDDYMQLLVYSVEITPVDSKNGNISNLEPCPFCGNEEPRLVDDGFHTEQFIADDKYEAYVYCDICGARGGSVIAERHTKVLDTNYLISSCDSIRRMAIEKWNNRK